MALMDSVEPDLRERLVHSLLEEVADMTVRELAMLLLECMDDGELACRVEELRTGVIVPDATMQ